MQHARDGIPSCTVDEDVIKEEKEKQLKIRFYNFIHEDLEGRRGIAKSKSHGTRIHSGLHGCEKSSSECLPLSSRSDGIPSEDLIW